MPAGRRTSTRQLPHIGHDAEPLLRPEYQPFVIRAGPDTEGIEQPQLLCAVSWNLLAPCWKRTGPGAGAREAGDPAAWRRRARRQIAALRAAGADVALLQEWWHAEEDYRGLWRGWVEEEGMHFFASPRTGGQPDGLAALVRWDMAEGAELRTYRFRDWGDRVAQLLTLPSLGVWVCNTHLTFAHPNDYDPQMRMGQARQLAGLLNSRVPADAPLLVAGDLNGPADDAAVAHLFSTAGLTPHLSGSEWVSHADHTGRRIGCDFVATRGGLRVARHRWVGDLDDPDALSDHLMLAADLTLPPPPPERVARL